MQSTDRKELFIAKPGCFVCQICVHYEAPDNSTKCLGCKHVGDFLDIEQKTETVEETIERNR